MNTVSLTLSQEQIDSLYKTYQQYAVKTPAYAQYQLKTKGCTITAYESKKVVFQGVDAEEIAALFEKRTITKTNSSKKLSVYPQAGSDEVGTGDYFGPVCVCAAYVDQDHAALMKELGIQDSKQLTDEQIIKIAPKLMESIPYSLLILDNYKYNQVHQTHNLNKIKAKLHNQAYIHLRNKLGELPALSVIDQFTPEASYYGYLKDEKEIVRKITFETKAENKYPAVACGSIIARYAFLKAMDTLSEHYHFKLPKGAGPATDPLIQKFYDLHGEKGLMNAAKVHFKNTEKIRK